MVKKINNTDIYYFVTTSHFEKAFPQMLILNPGPSGKNI